MSQKLSKCVKNCLKVSKTFIICRKICEQYFWERKKWCHSLVEENECTSNAAGVKRVRLQNGITEYIMRTIPNTKKYIWIYK